jgi:hypothetical protein
MRALETRVDWLEADDGTPEPDVTDRSAWDSYAVLCPCGRPAGECPTHPRARSTQRPPACDWRVWAYGRTSAGPTTRRLLGFLSAPFTVDRI